MRYWLLLFLFLTSSVFADPITVAFLSSLTSGATIFGLSTITSAFIYAAATFALIKLSEPKSAPSYDLGDQARTQVIRSSSSERKLVYGETKVNGLLAYIHVDSSDYLHLVLVWAHQVSEEVVGLYVNDEYVPTPTSGNSVIVGKYANHIEMYHHLGEQTAADSVLVSRVSEWTTEHKLLGQTYSYIRIEKDNDLFPYGIPTINSVLKGKKVIDPRESETTKNFNIPNNSLTFFQQNSNITLKTWGGNLSYPSSTIAIGYENSSAVITLRQSSDQSVVSSYAAIYFFDLQGAKASNITLTVGSSSISLVEQVETSSDAVDTFLQTLTSGSISLTLSCTISYNQTMLYSSNPILCAADYIRSPYGLNTTNIRDHSFSSNICDELITSTDSEGLAFSEKRYEMSAVVGLNEGKLSVLDKIRQSCDGNFYYSGGQWVLDVGRVKTTETRVITENDLTQPVTYSTHISNRELFNTITPKLIDRGDSWRVTTAPNVRIPAAVNEDGRVITKVIDFSYVRTSTRALSLAAISLLKHRNKKALQLVGKLGLFQYELGDVVSIELSNLSLAGVLFEVTEVKLTGLEVSLSLHEYTDGVYADSPAVQFDEFPDLVYTNSVEFTTTGTHTWTVPVNAIDNNFRVYIGSGSGGSVTILEAMDSEATCIIPVGTQSGGGYGYHSSVQTITDTTISVTVGSNGSNRTINCSPALVASQTKGNIGGSTTFGSLVTVPGGGGAQGNYSVPHYNSENLRDGYIGHFGSSGEPSSLRVGSSQGSNRVIIEWNI